jgi:hypothetical protein
LLAITPILFLHYGFSHHVDYDIMQCLGEYPVFFFVFFVVIASVYYLGCIYEHSRARWTYFQRLIRCVCRVIIEVRELRRCLT